MTLLSKFEGPLNVACAQVRNLVDAALPLLADASLPLEERWELFKYLSANTAMNCESYGNGLISHLGRDRSLYDDFYVSRHETEEYVSMWEKVQDHILGEVVTQEQAAAWLEAVLVEASQGYNRFTYDW